MTIVLLIILLLVTIALIGVILMQRSDGGALGIGGGGPGGMMSGASAESLLTRTTMILGIVFMGTCILLAVLSGASSDTGSIADELAGDNQDGLPLSFADIDDAPAADKEPPAEVPGDEPTGDVPAEVPGR